MSQSQAKGYALTEAYNDVKYAGERVEKAEREWLSAPEEEKDKKENELLKARSYLKEEVDRLRKLKNQY